MKQSITILLALILLLQTFSRFVVEADYFLNRGYIAKVLCINNDKPKMHCNGKCYLAKQLNKQDKQEQQSPSNKKVKIEVQLFNLSEPAQVNVCENAYQPKHSASYLLPLSSYAHSIFRPPIV